MEALLSVFLIAPQVEQHLESTLMFWVNCLAGFRA